MATPSGPVHVTPCGPMACLARGAGPTQSTAFPSYGPGLWRGSVATRLLARLDRARVVARLWSACVSREGGTGGTRPAQPVDMHTHFSGVENGSP